MGFTPEEIEAFRSVTPGCRQTIHFNNAGAALPPLIVTDTMINYLREESLIGAYEARRKHTDEISQVYCSLAAFLNAHPFEIAIVENATVAFQQALGSVPLSRGDKILCSSVEYHANFIPLLQLVQRSGVTVEVVPFDKDGAIDLTVLERRLAEDNTVKLIVLTHVPCNNGLVNPAEAVGKLAKQYNILYLLDACQSVGQVPIDVERIGCDLLSATGRKWLRGPRGIGFLYARSSSLSRLKEPTFLDSHSADWSTKDSYVVHNDASRFENWEFNYSAVLGLGAAVQYASDIGIQRIWDRVMRLALELRKGLREIEGVLVRDYGAIQSGIVSFKVADITPAYVQAFLWTRKINVWVSGPTASLIDMIHSDEGVVRASVHYYNTHEEVAELIRGVRECIQTHQKNPGAPPPVSQTSKEDDAATAALVLAMNQSMSSRMGSAGGGGGHPSVVPAQPPGQVRVGPPPEPGQGRVTVRIRLLSSGETN